MALRQLLLPLLVLGSLLAACSTPTPQIIREQVVVEKPVEKVVKETAVPRPQEKSVERVVTAVPAPASTAAAGQQAALGDVAPSPYQAGRMIIKSGEMNLLVADTDRAVDQVTEIAVLSGGYVISSQTLMREGYKIAALKLGVPVERFEDVQRQLRAIAIQVQNELASGQDVSDEYVDLQSRLLNLEATAARVREFLVQAKTVEEALKVNAQLTEIESEIERIKGRMNYLRDRAAFSTLVVNLEPQRPSPTPTPTPTVTPTPTPDVWRPGETVTAASGTLQVILQAFGDILIWFTVVILPFVLLIVVVVTLMLWVSRRSKRV
ncbi:MAG: DUF4349 domain-containing protein [Anaerolineae bacterium]|nr:DUF4349 domain-containing protein [Anaerolineae bacterium]